MKKNKNIYKVKQEITFSISQGLRSWDQFRKNTSFGEKKNEKHILFSFRNFPDISDAHRS